VASISAAMRHNDRNQATMLMVIGTMVTALIEQHETFMFQYRIDLAKPDASQRVAHFV
jgi:VanZ family protein